jgi:hypothetical protein
LSPTVCLTADPVVDALGFGEQARAALALGQAYHLRMYGKSTQRGLEEMGVRILSNKNHLSGV